MEESIDTAEEIDDEYSRRTTLKTLGAAGAGLAGSVVATGDASAAGPTAVIDASPLPASNDESVSFDGSGSSGNIQSYDWYIRNNEMSNSFPSSPSRTGSSFSEQFAAYAFSVKLVVTDDSGDTDSAVVDFIIKDSVDPYARIVAEPLSSDGDLQTFVGRYSTTPRGSIDKYEWYIRNDDLSSSFSKYAEGPSFTEQFADYQYSVKLVITDTRGKTASDTVTFQG